MNYTNKPPAFLISTILLSLLWLGEGNLYRAVQWNPLNPLFKTSNNSKSYLQINVAMKSQMNIICPNVATNLIYLDSSIAKDYLYENLMFVDKESFEACSVKKTSKISRKLFSCDDPVNLKYKVLTFKAISPIKGEPEFEAGKEYFFIATSNGSKISLDNQHLGHCKTHNMRLKIYICVNKNDPKCKKANETVEPKSTPTSPPIIKNIQNDLVEVKAGQSAKGCFMTSGDKTWLIAIGVIVGIVLMLLLGCLVFTCCRRKRSPFNDREGKIPLNDRTDTNGV